MNQPLDFSDRDLRNRSFKGRKDLAGANFRKADIRGCDFSEANLDGTDFSGVTAGQSFKQVLNTVAIAVAIAGEVTFAIAGVGAVAFAVAIAGAVVGAIAGVGAVAFVGAFAGAGVGVGVVAGEEFAKGNYVRGFLYSLIAILFLFLTYRSLTKAVEEIRNTYGTSFKDAAISKAKFTGAILNNCDFTNANLYQTDWTHAHFTCSKFSENLGIREVQELCISRIGANEDFSSIDLSGLHLVGVNLSGANLSSANLNDSNLSQSTLENAILANTQAAKYRTKN